MSPPILALDMGLTVLEGRFSIDVVGGGVTSPTVLLPFITLTSKEGVRRSRSEEELLLRFGWVCLPGLLRGFKELYSLTSESVSALTLPLVNEAQPSAD